MVYVATHVENNIDSGEGVTSCSKNIRKKGRNLGRVLL